MTDQHGFTWYQREDGVIVYHLADVRRVTIDMWLQTSLGHDTAYAKTNQHVCRILDIREAGWPTPYALGQINKSAHLTPKGLRESLAVLVKDSLAFQMAEVAMRRFVPHLQQTSRLFRDENAALEWLQERRRMLED